MALPPFLKKIFNDILHINYRKTTNITININKVVVVKNDNRKYEIIKGKNKHDELVINTNKLNTQEIKKLGELAKEYKVSEGKILKENTLRKYNELLNYKESKEAAAIKEFFRPIIPADDLDALDTALMMRAKFERNEDIKEEKFDLLKRYQDRGRNIGNLCTAKYFDSYLMELYNHRESDEKFKELYEGIISNAVLAIFVNERMTKITLDKEIKPKLAANKRYGLSAFYIHGLGVFNVNTIHQWLEENKGNYLYKLLIDKKDITIVELLIE